MHNVFVIGNLILDALENYPSLLIYMLLVVKFSYLSILS